MAGDLVSTDGVAFISRPAGPQLGFELKLAVQAPDVKWTDHVQRPSGALGRPPDHWPLPRSGRHPPGEGATRWKCPFCSGLLRSRSFPKTVGTSRNAPLVDVDAERCCTGTLTTMPPELPWTQEIPFGTTACVDRHWPAPGGGVGKRRAQGRFTRPEPWLPTPRC